MLDVETNHQHTGEATLKLFFQTFIVVRIITIAEHIGCCQLFLFIADNVDSAECYYTAKEGGVLLRLHIILLDDTEGCFVRLEDSINFMSAQSAVEIQSFISYSIFTYDNPLVFLNPSLTDGRERKEVCRHV